MTQKDLKKLNRVPLTYAYFSLQSTMRAMTQAQRERMKQLLQTFIEQLPPGLSSRQIALLFYRVVTRCITYNQDEQDWHLRYTYAGAVLTGSAVCMGISELYAILCGACGIKSEVVIGCIEDAPYYHAWVQLWLPDEKGELVCYHCDPTWDLTRDRDSLTYYLKSDAFMRREQHLWLEERYASCPVDCTGLPWVAPELTERMCGAFRKMHSPRRDAVLKNPKRS